MNVLILRKQEKQSAREERNTEGSEFILGSYKKIFAHRKQLECLKIFLIVLQNMQKCSSCVVNEQQNKTHLCLSLVSL